MIAALRYLAIKGYRQWAGWSISTLLWVTTAATTIFFGGLAYQNATSFIVCLMVAAATLGSREAMFFAVLSTMWCGLIAYLQTTNLLPPSLAPQSHINSWIAIVISMLLGTYILHLTMTYLQNIESRLRDLTVKDPLTGLFNRRHFSKTVNELVLDYPTSNKNFAIFLLDLDNFKNINDSLGHNLGDRLLAKVSHSLDQVIRHEDVLCRFGGDEFVVICKDIQSDSELFEISNKLISVFNTPFNIEGRLMEITASIGISTFPEDGMSAEELTKNSDLAMFESKSEGKNRYKVYNTSMHEKLHNLLALEQDLKNGLSKDQYEVFYQGKYDTDATLAGAEALLRWCDDNNDLRSPAEFISVLEKNKQIIPVGYWVIADVVRTMKHWPVSIPVAINVSPVQFSDPRLVTHIQSIIRKAGMEGSRLEIEITENATAQDYSHSIKLIETFSRMGLRIAIDDFGTGYSSFAKLSHYPIDSLKIDRSFVSRFETDAKARAIVESILNLGHNLGIDIVAEGVETESQFVLLKELGCSFFQGYFFGRPIARDEFEKLLP